MATEIGTVIDGKYEVLKQIGKGGMSVVYLAMDKRLNKQWAVKEIRKTAGSKNDEIVINSLLAEANLMKRLDHPTLPRIVDIIDNGKTLYVIMDYIEGESLDKILEAEGPQPEKLVLSWALQICDALNYLHSQKPPIIYRDMKPANIMLKPEGNIKIIDFGIAREYKEQNLSDTTVLGTKGYASPEHYGSRQTDARSDIFTLGMTIHHLLTGVDPRSADYIYAPVRQWNPSLSEGIEAIIDKCTQLNPEDRYQNCNELMYDLQHPEELGGNIKKKKKKKLLAFSVSLSLAVIMALTGTASQLLSVNAMNHDYDAKISVPVSASNAAETYCEAIELMPSDTRAYEKLLQSYESNQRFGDAESKQFSYYYNKNQALFSSKDTAYLQLAYDAGITFFYMYTPESDPSFRSRVLKAKPYFETVVQSGNQAFEYYDISQSYYLIGAFYSNFVVNTTSVKEPKKADYDSLLSAVQICMENMEHYDYEDAAYIKLTMYNEIANLLSDHKKGLAASGVDIHKVLHVLDTIHAEAEQLSVTQQTSIALREALLGAYEKNRQAIETTYANTVQRSE